MNKAELVTYVKEFTGNRTITSFVMNTILDEAQSYLANKLPIYMLRQAEPATWTSTAKRAVIPIPKAIYRVSWVKSDGSEVSLQRVMPDDVFALAKATGSPKFYAVMVAQPGPSGTKAPNDIPVVENANFDKASILIAPVNEGLTSVNLKVEGSFLQKMPSSMEDDETNVWMTRFPSLMAKAAAYAVSVRYDNQQKTALLLDSLERTIEATIKGWADIEFGDLQLKMGG